MRLHACTGPWLTAYLPGLSAAQQPQTLEQDGLGQTDPLELTEVQALVGAVRSGVRVLDTRDQNPGVREPLGERGHERDRTTDADVDRRDAPRIGEGRARLVIDGTVGVSGETGALVVKLDVDLDAPRRVGPKVVREQPIGLLRVLVGAMRMEIFAAACGTRVLDEVATDGASMPMVVIDGLVHSRDRIEPEPIISTPSSRPDSSRSRSSG